VTVHLALRPFEIARHAVAAVPGVVGSLAEKGCAQIADAPAQIKKLQALGEMAVNMGRRRLRRKVGARIEEVRRTAGDFADRTFGNGYAPMATTPATTATAAARPPAATPRPPAPKPTAVRPPAAAPKPPAPTPAAAPPPAATPKPPAPKPPASKPPAAKRSAPKRAPDVTGLPIPDYDELSASQVASRLAGLSAEELESVRAYEAANRARKTVLAAVDRHRPS
jgi:hypothetical protein